MTSVQQRAMETAMARYGVKPDMTKVAFLPELLAAGLAGGAAYKYLRTPSGAANPVMQAVGATPGMPFRKLVDVHPRPPTEANAKSPFAALYHKWLKPRVSPQGELTPLNRFRLWLTEGENAVPYYYGAAENGKTTLLRPAENGMNPEPLKADGSLTYGGLSFRNSPRKNLMSQVVEGGQPLEGDMGTLRRLAKTTHMGKGYEANLLNQYAPGAIPNTIPYATKFMPTTGADDFERIRGLQANLQQHYGQTPFIAKLDKGFQSSGKLPLHNEDWADHLFRYRQAARKDPELVKALEQAAASGVPPQALVNRLHANDVYQGYVLDHAIRDPKSLSIQEFIPKDTHIGEVRAHVMHGQVPAETIYSRFGQPLSDEHTANVRSFLAETFQKLPEDYRKALFAPDVLVYRKPDGSTGYKLMEMNMTVPPIGQNQGFHSGFLDTGTNPLAPHTMQRVLTGRHTQPVAALAGLGAAGAAAGAAHLLTPKSEEEQPAG